MIQFLTTIIYELIKTLISLIKSVVHASDIFNKVKFKIYIIDHNSSKKQINDLKIILEKSNLSFEILALKLKEFSNLIKNTNEENNQVTDNQKSNMSNIHQSLILSKEKSDDLTYFVEDDYIHEKDSLIEMLYTY